MKPLFKKRTIVTGGAGFIGSNYLNYAVKKYPRELFINVDLLTYAADVRNVTVGKSKNYVFEKADICDSAAMSAIFEKYTPTHVIHFAAESHVDQSIADPSVCIRTNVDGTNKLLQLARDHKVERFHLISTDEVYGSLTKDDPPRTEDSPFNPRNPYSASKVSAELLLRAYTQTYGLPGVITRSSNNYGPNQDATKLIPKFITNLLEGKKVPLYATGENIRDWLYVGDDVHAIDLVFRKGRNGETYNIGGGEEYTNLEVTRALLKSLRKTEKEVEYVADRPGHDFRYALSNKKIEKEFGWKPKVRFADGIKKTILFYKKRLGHV
ncbi:dTDP-glucose 4,6-dehydratase [Candidatus Kaiserbacteria bacterium RIFCSPLOWO2_01_FULL_54_20]|uniref:dTDP-glucose 4,6-dehydratase n=1 Tax=Candidatus Kaiserbacteria bacterium RIFCSPLOWO2_01_FULL_54_20 TaxID=1798513 RepID=A0A1F6EJM2_9BACT|nr:MAG: dTDP-glucose 4,6-dehydratase [Candidatus Kaiserbacteria bacterium RIFCSPLOWO2_01_FULL_54_20]